MFNRWRSALRLLRKLLSKKSQNEPDHERAKPGWLIRDKRINQDGASLLERDSPEVIVGGLFGKLKSQSLPGRIPEQPILVQTEDKAFAAFKRLGLKEKFDGYDAGLVRGLAHQGKFALFPSVVTELRSEYLLNRAVAARTLFHEFFHALRISPNKQTPMSLEEGWADIFASIMCEKYFGDAFSDYSRYREYMEGGQKLCFLLGEGDCDAGWKVALQSRAESNMYAYLEEKLEKCGVCSHDISRILGYPTSVDTWLSVIRRYT